MDEKRDVVAIALLRWLTTRGGIQLQKLRALNEEPAFAGSLGVTVTPDDLHVAAWGLVARRLAFVDMGGSQGSTHFLTFKLTDWGHDAADQPGGYTPHASEPYMNRLRQEIPNISGPTCTYLVEALAAFNQGLYLSTTVMLGAAIECSFLEMVEMYLGFLPSAERASFAKVTKGPISAVVKEFGFRIEPRRKDFPEGLREGSSLLDAVQHVLRTNRNEAGHPTGRRFHRDECQAAFFVAPSSLAYICGLKTHFLANPSA